MKYFSLIVLLIVTLTITSQNKKQDSIQFINVISKADKETDSILQLKGYEKALSFSKETNFNYGIYKSYLKTARWKKSKFNSDSAILEYKKAFKILPENYSYSYHIIQLIGDEFSKKSLYDSAIYYHNKSIKIAKKYSKNHKIVSAYISIGNIWNQTYDYDKAFKFYSRADSICENDSKLRVSKIRATINNYLGFSVRKSNGYKDAIRYYIKAKEINKKLGNENGVQEANIAIAQAYTSFKDYNKALKLLNESIAYHKVHMANENSYSYAIIVRGYLFLQMEKYKAAEKDYLLYYDLAVQNKNDFYERSGLGYLGYFYETSNQLLKAEKYYKLAIEKNKLVNDNGRILQNTDGLITVYKKNKNYKRLATYYDLKIELQKKIDQQKIAQETRDLEAKYQNDKKEQEIALLESENKFINQKQKSQRNIFIGGITITSLAGLFLFVLFRNRKKTNNKLKELDAIKSNFFANISHEFRTPLTLIANPIETTLNDDTISEVKREQFITAKRNSDRLLALVNQILDLSKIDANQLKLHIQNANIITLVAALTESFNHAAKQKQIKYKLHINPHTENVCFDRDALEKIIVNLISNAIKYTPENGSVHCDAFIKNNKLHFIVKNSGIVLTADEIKHIFQRFYQTKDQNQGTGIGLALVKELVDLHKGTIDVDSTPNQWTTFRVVIPVDKQSFKNETFIAKTEDLKVNTQALIEQKQAVITEEEFTDTDEPILLLVEDNEDVRLLLKQTFENNYNIITAPNGEKGIELALEHIPDLIISDIMMPVKDGIALTEQLKTDERTSHIPIILLTAKAGDENKLTGLEVGADDYITKPFNSKLIITKAEKLIENRRLLQQRYSQELVLLPKDISITNLDEQFLDKVQTTLDKNLIEPSFNVTEFSEAVGMSRMQLHRKLKALTGLTASEFIRSQRLMLAAQFLKTSDINISQVGYSVGFNDHSYFTKCFKEFYKCTPTEYAKRK
ncbi:response regulator [Winogradskyella sp. PE311]|uniref:hybrid sensor histidine kinase/response regulator transcription factor n=1 Tax=Winogradskyella sp. PE311 TaxID=3366943 RepID=UPI00397EF27F